MNPHWPRRRPAGFTLIELLAVIAVIGILAAILIPTVGAVRVSANKARTRLQFNQWAAAIESFRNEYGYYPVFHGTQLVNGGATGNAGAPHLFFDVLSGHKRDGSALTNTGATSAAGQNRKLIAFYSFPESDFTVPSSATPNLIRDSSDNTEIAVLVDRDLDGVITIGAGGDYASLPPVAGLTPTSGTTDSDVPAPGIRTGTIFYAPAPGATVANPQFVFSWK